MQGVKIFQPSKLKVENWILLIIWGVKSKKKNPELFIVIGNTEIFICKICFSGRKHRRSREQRLKDRD